MNLFKWGEFTSHSGLSLPFKIDCDALTDEDLDTLAKLISIQGGYSSVIGIPTGGIRFANALGKYCTQWGIATLLVDDVLTTGNSMEEYRDKISTNNVIGIVIFARSKPADWILPIFTLSSQLGAVRLAV